MSYQINHRTTLRLDIASAFLLMATLLGCSDGPQRFPVSGTVELDGKPLSEGRIVFVPVDSGRTATGQIVDGKYSLSTDGQTGARPGSYRVAIKPPGNSVGEEAQERPVSVFVPERYQNESTSELEFTVSGSSANTADFPLTK